MAGVFISYRRQDTAGWAGRLHDHLEERLGADQVFIDVATLRPGEDYTAAIARTIQTCDTMLLLIGTGWLDATDDSGARRLSDADDLHRTEIRLALERDIATVPVLVDGATLPDESSLPSDLAPLARRHAVELTAAGFSRQVDDLVADLRPSETSFAESLPREQAEPAPPGPGRKTRIHPVPLLIGAAALIVVVGLVILVAGGGSGDDRRIPDVGDSFQYQLADLPIDQSVDADVFDIDLFETPIGTIEALRDRGATVVCYFSAGSFEDVRPDADRFPDDLLGEPLVDFADELWVDPRRLDDLMPIMEDRLDLCAQKGFDAVEFDNVDAFANDSGFDLTEGDQLAYLERLASAARDRGLSPGLKNALDLIPDLVDDFDWALIEQCHEFEECSLARPFLDDDKAVFMVEYDADLAEACAQAPAGATVIRKDPDLGPTIERCP